MRFSVRLSRGALFYFKGYIMYTKKELEQYGFYFIRQIAREIGVKNASTFKKKELIDAILDVQNGFVKPYFPTKGKGRPAMKIFQDPLKDKQSSKEIEEIVLADTKNRKVELFEKKLDEIYQEFKQLLLSTIK